MPNVLLTFEDLHKGDIVGNQYQSDGVTISTLDDDHKPMVFDTDHPTGHDYDLATNNMGNVLIISEDNDSHDPDDNAGGGTFVFDFDEPTEVLNFRVLDIEEHGGVVRLYDEDGNLINTVNLPITGNNGQGTVHINTDNVARMEVELAGSGAIDGICYCTPDDVVDGIVEGTNDGETIDVAYTGDPDGDMIDANDAVPGIGSGDEDIVDAFGGDDTINAGEADDQVFAGSGNDTVNGGAGDDIIYGDSNYSGPGEGVTVRESLNWIQNQHDTGGFTQNTGSVDVTFSVEREEGSAETEFASNDQLITGINSGDEAIDDDSSLSSTTNGQGNDIEYALDFSESVETVSFRINDIDGDGIVTVRAFDEHGNPITVNLRAGDDLTLSDTDGVAGADTADSNGGYANDTANQYSLFVTIPGPVSRIEIDHSQNGGNNSGINITDVFFDVAVVDNGEDGNDTLRGGDGNDTIFGEGGDDRLEGQAGDDTLDGGDGNDVIIGGSGNDTAEGGAGNDEIWMGSGSDTVNAGDGNDWVHGQGGDDTLNGEDGDDMLFGEAGNDTLTGGAGADAISGGDGRDTIIGGNDGDTVDGGTGGDDFDVLDLTGEGVFRVVNETVDADGDSTSGTVEFLDGGGNVTGSLEFTEIEQIIGDRVNQGPTANDDTATVDEDDSVTIDVLGNDTDPEGDDLTVIEATSPDGDVTINADGTITFTPNENFNGDTTIDYEIEDEAGNISMATVNVTVTPVNDAPDAVNDVDTTDEDTPITLDVLANDTDIDGDTLTVTGATVPAEQGTVEIVGNQVVFTPAENFNGLATISYSIEDGNGGTDTAIHEVNVTPVNDAPVAVDDIASTQEDTAVVIDLIDNDFDVDGDDLTIGTVSVPADQGTVVDNGDGTVTFTPAPNYTGPATIEYTVVDGNGGEDVGGAVVNVFIEGVNDGPDAVDDAVTTDEDTPITIDALANDTDMEGDALTITGASVPSEQGSVEVVGNQLVFTPAENFNGEATITYSITDGNGGTDTAEVAVTVTPVNDDPVAVDDVETTDEDQAITIDLISNDTDVDGDPLSVGSVSVPADQGTVVDNGDGTVTFTPAPNFNGPATITYTVVDGQGGEDEGEAVVSVGAINDGPVANDGSDTTDEDTPITVDLVANDTDADGDALSVISATVPADQGTLVNNGDGTVTFTPAENFNGDATISYEISDGNGGTDTADHVITVTPVNDDPVAVDDDVTVDEDDSVIIDPIANDTDADGDTLTVQSIDTQPTNGTLIDNGDGTYTYEPDPGYNGPDSFTYTVSDGNGGTDTGTVNITVNSVNDGPDAVDDTANGTIVAPVIINVVGNDTDPDGDTLTVDSFTQPAAGGTVTDNGDGTLTFTPDGTVDGEITFEYTITDGNGGFDTATVMVLVRDGIVEGTDGDDVIQAVTYLDDPEGDVIDGGDAILPGEAPQDDIVFAGNGNDIVNAGEGDDEVYGEDGDDTLNGGAGDDYLSGGEGADILSGGEGNDTLDAGQGGDELYGEEGDDLLLGGPGPDLLDGGEGDDDIRGGNASDIIIGGDGSDTVQGNDGDDVIDTSGGSPRPDLGYPGLFPADTDPNDDIDFVDGGAGDDTITTGDDADTIFGGTGNDTIDGGIDADTIDGGEGDDRIVGGEGSDIIDGGAGDDTIYAGIDPDLGLPDNLDIPDAIDLVPNNGMDVVNGGDGNDTIFGADDDDVLNGDAGDDFIDGGIDDDTITGGTGDDTLVGGEGADDISGGDDADTFLVGAGEGIGDVIDGGTGGNDFDTLDLTGSGPLRIVGETVDADGDSTSGTIEFLDGVGGAVIGTLEFSEIENIVPCFTPGTSIATPRGEMLVEDLQVGDKIITRDNGIQEIRWIGAKRMDGRELQNNPHLQPVLIQKGSLGNGLPERDMLVSPNHRMLVNNDRVSLYFEENEVLVSAKHLVNPTEGVQSINSMGTTYIHFMFDNHEVVLSNGAWTESFQPGDYSLKGIGNAQRNEIFELFPELQGQKGREAYASARLTLKKHEARMLFK